MATAKPASTTKDKVKLGLAAAMLVIAVALVLNFAGVFDPAPVGGPDMPLAERDPVVGGPPPADEPPPKSGFSRKPVQLPGN